MYKSRLERLLSSNVKNAWPGSIFRVHPVKDEKPVFLKHETLSKRNNALPFSMIISAPLSPFDDEWQAIQKEIKGAEYIVQIENELDSDEFVPYTKETLYRATQFLERLMIHAHSASIVGVGVPRIGPAEKGSVDLFWEKPDRTLLINFPSQGNEANFYGRKAKSEISGRFDPSDSRPELAFWLAD